VKWSRAGQKGGKFRHLITAVIDLSFRWFETHTLEAGELMSVVARIPTDGR
jgi:hypothetical protein